MDSSATQVEIVGYQVLYRWRMQHKAERKMSVRKIVINTLILHRPLQEFTGKLNDKDFSTTFRMKRHAAAKLLSIIESLLCRKTVLKLFKNRMQSLMKSSWPLSFVN